MPSSPPQPRRSSRSALHLVCTVIALALPVVGTGRRAQAKAYKGAEVYSKKSVLYGRMEMRMRMIRGSGLLSTFFTYKDGSELSGALWEELDVEALGKDDAKAWQSNLITGNPRVTSEQMHTSPTSLADDYHTYQIEWTPEYVSWSFDGVEVRRTVGGQASELTNAHTLRFNVWASESSGWAGNFAESALPAYQFVNWIRYYRYEDGKFALDWTDDFETFDTSRWSKGTWTFDGNRVDFATANAVVQDGTLILAITKEAATGFSGSVPVDPQGDASNAPVPLSEPTTPTAPTGSSSDSGCSLAPSRPSHPDATAFAALCLLVLASARLAGVGEHGGGHQAGVGGGRAVVAGTRGRRRWAGPVRSTCRARIASALRATSLSDPSRRLAGKDSSAHREYPGLDHGPGIEAARSEPGLFAWLLAQHRD